MNFIITKLKNKINQKWKGVFMNQCIFCGGNENLIINPIDIKHHVCKKCFEKEFFICPVCGDFHLLANSSIVEYNNKMQNVCNNCVQRIYIHCHSCHRLITSYDAELLNGHQFCKECYAKCAREEMKPTISRAIYGYHDHHDLLPLKFSMPNEENVPFFGIELEVDCKSNISYSHLHEIAFNISEVMPEYFVYFENDGSLNYGFENITNPATLAYHENIETNYRRMFAIIRRAHLRSHQTSTCGLHVHFNRDFFEENEEEACVARLLYLVEKFWDNIVIFSRRTNRTLNRWAGKYEENYNNVAKDWKNGYHLDRYKAVNLNNKNTIEFRMFRGTLKWNTFIATIQLCNNMVVYAKYHTIADIQNMSWETLINTDELKQYWEEAKIRAESKKRQGVV